MLIENNKKIIINGKKNININYLFNGLMNNIYVPLIIQN